MAGFELVGTGITDKGMKRTQNQDKLLVKPELNLFVVADGMGGHQGGEIASEIAIEGIYQFIEQNKTIGDAISLLKQAIESANQKIQERSRSDANLHGMGTTTTALLFRNTKLYIGHVGDSRCYLIQPRRIWQLTQDHSLVQEKLKAGIITRDQVKTDKMKNVITRSVGFEDNVEVDIYEYDIKPLDVFVVCSDGLSGMLDDQAICQIVQTEIFEKPQNSERVKNAAKRLVDTANSNGGDDNVTAIVVQVQQNS